MYMELLPFHWQPVEGGGNSDAGDMDQVDLDFTDQISNCLIYMYHYMYIMLEMFSLV